MDNLPLFVLTRTKMDNCPNAVAVRSRPNEFQPKAVIGSSLVMKQICWPAIGRNQEIDKAVIVDIAIRRATSDLWTCECLAHLSGDFFKLAGANVAEQVGRFRVAHSLLNALDFILDMPIGNEDVLPTVIVVINEEAAEAQCYQSGPTHL